MESIIMEAWQGAVQGIYTLENLVCSQTPVRGVGEIVKIHQIPELLEILLVRDLSIRLNIYKSCKCGILNANVSF